MKHFGAMTHPGSIVVGISAFFHDSACALIRDGELVCAAEEERFSRIKHDKSVPRRAFRYCLEQAGVSIDRVGCIAFYEQPVKKTERQLWMAMQEHATQAHRLRILQELDPGRLERDLREVLGFEGRIESVGHHEAHAASSFFFSGFEEAAVFTVDGVGEWTTTAYGRAQGADLELFEEVCFPHSLGLLYSAITAYLGFEVNEGEYKVMGLAPYGTGRFVEQMRAIVESVPGTGQYRLNLEFFDFLAGGEMYSDRLVELLGEAPRVPGSDLRGFHCDVARSLQMLLEEILLEKVRYLHERVPSENLCMAGGVALNCVANGEILRQGPFSRLFVQPAAGDSGGALGAAALVYRRQTGERIAPKRLSHAYLGPAWSNEQIEKLVDGSLLNARSFRGSSEALLEATVDRLAAGKVVGWFCGRLEFGPRALGARSILADPRVPDMRDRINALVKMREAFRPFAPAVLSQEAHKHFDIDHPSPFMLETCQVISELSLPAVTHVDGSARVQTVDVGAEHRFGELLRCFFERTGCPILLNTSFNVKGEPIVCSPLDAILCFLKSKLDVLVLEDFLIDRDTVDSELLARVAQLDEASAQGPAISHRVYTFF